MANFTAGTSFTDGVTNDVTSAKLNALIADATPTANLSLNSTTGTISNFTSSTVNATLGTLTTGVIGTGTFGTTTSTAATITTLNSTTGTIGNLSTTLAGDFTISQGTGTIGTSAVTTAKINDGAVTAAKMSNPQYTGFRNKIINGDMVIDQRNAGASVTPANSCTLDRWYAAVAQTGKFTVQQNAGSVTPPAGFTNYLGVTSLSAYSVLTNDYFSIAQYIEGFNVADLDFGKSTAKTITLSFWVRSSLTGTFGGSLQGAPSAILRSYPFSYTISSSNTWEQKTITIAGDTFTNTWDTTNGIGLYVNIGLGAGSSFKATAGTWASANYLNATGATSLVGTNGATFYITGVQLEKGSTATDFERRPYGTELALCQRYFYSEGQLNNGFAPFAVGNARGNGYSLVLRQHPVVMRSSPSISISSASHFLLDEGYIGGSLSQYTPTSINIDRYTNSCVMIGVGSSSGPTAGRAIILYGDGGGLARMNFSSEL